MENLDAGVIKQLLENQATPAVTIYIPMHTTASPPHITENQIRFKNLLHKAVSELPEHGSGHELALALEQRINELHDDLEFWENQTPGLLLCATPDNIRMIHLPIDTEEYVSIDDEFHLAPVLGLIEDAKEYYVLILAQHNPKLYKGNLYGLQPVGINLPASKETALNIDENNQKTENQGTAAGPSTQGSASSPNVSRGWFNGRGGARNPQEEDRMRFFRLIDARINNHIDKPLPLILAGIDAEISEYRAISKYPKLLQTSILGNHTATTSEKLFDEASNIIRQEVVEPEHQAAVEEYNRLSGANPDRVARDQKQMLAAAEQGRIDKLLTSVYQNTSDTVRDSMAEVLRITFPDSATSKTLNKLAAQVWQMRGRVINLLPDQIPAGTTMVARLRY